MTTKTPEEVAYRQVESISEHVPLDEDAQSFWINQIREAIEADRAQRTPASDAEFFYENVIKGLRSEIDNLVTQRSIRDETIARLRKGISEAVENYQDVIAKYQRGEITLGEAFDAIYGGAA